MRSVEFTLLTAGDMSAATVTSSAENFNQAALGGIQAVWTGSPVGTLILQISNDNVTFSDYTGSSTAVSGAGDFMWNLLDIGYQWIRVKYTRVSGTGSLTVTLSYKGV